MTTTAKPRKLTSEEWDEAVSLGRARARDGFSIYSNPYGRERQSEQWHLFRLAFADATSGDDSDTATRTAAHDAQSEAIAALKELFLVGSGA